MITSENIVAHEMNGLHVRITRSENPQIVGMAGRIVRESKNMFTIQNGLALKMYPKSGSTWEFDISGTICAIDGATIAHRPNERSRRV